MENKIYEYLSKPPKSREEEATKELIYINNSKNTEYPTQSEFEINARDEQS
jgi:hypothetical protein